MCPLFAINLSPRDILLGSCHMVRDKIVDVPAVDAPTAASVMYPCMFTAAEAISVGPLSSVKFQLSWLLSYFAGLLVCFRSICSTAMLSHYRTGVPSFSQL